MTAAHVRVARLVCLALALVSSALFAQEVTLKVSHFLPPNSNCQKAVLEPWCDKLAKDTPYIETAKGAMPFLASGLVGIVLLPVPGPCLWLVHLNA